MLPKPWGSLVIPSPPGDWHCAQDRVMMKDKGGDSNCFQP